MVLSASFLSLNDKKLIKSLAKEQIDYLHLDIMDGKYVPNKTLPFETLKTYLEGINKPYDVHLMVEDVLSYVKTFQALKPEFITFHIDATNNILEIINYLKQNDIKVGLALKPDESLDILEKYLDKIDLVLIMSVKPGKGGQKFIPSVLTKVEKLKKIKEENNYQFLIEIDGGINDKNIKDCLHCDMVVVGSFINSGDFKSRIEKLRSAYEV